MSGISMKELAQELGVSTASVSVALRGKPGISEETRKRILSYARKCGYDMSRLSDSDTKGTIAIIDCIYYGYAMEIREKFSYYAQFMDAASAEIARCGYVMKGPYSPVQEIPKADGYIMIGAAMPKERLSEFLKDKTPAVVAGPVIGDIQVTTVVHDNFFGIGSAVKHLKAQGYQKVGYVRSIPGYIGDERYDAYIGQLKKEGLQAGEFIDLRIEDAIFDRNVMLDIAERWFESHDFHADAFVCDNDYIAAALMRAMRGKNMIPGIDVAVTGFDDDDFAVLLEPPLTSVHTFEPELACVCVNQLIYSMEHPNAVCRHIKIGTKLIVRQSTMLRTGDGK